MFYHRKFSRILCNLEKMYALKKFLAFCTILVYKVSIVPEFISLDEFEYHKIF